MESAADRPVKAKDAKTCQHRLIKPVIMLAFCAICFCQLSCKPVESSPSEPAMKNHAMNTQEQAFSVNRLKSICQVPGKCDWISPCEGRTAWVKGNIDPLNIFDYSSYPQLEYQKFRIMDTSGEFLEIFVESDNSKEIFSALYSHLETNPSRVLVLGIVKGTDHQVMSQCKRNIFLILDNQGKIIFSP